MASPLSRAFWNFGRAGESEHPELTDLASKRMFQRIQTLFLTRLSEATRGTQTAPLLTIPVK